MSESQAGQHQEHGGDAGGGRSTVVVAHPSADLYGSDRVMLESVSALVEAGHHVVVTLPADGPLVPLLEERGAEVDLTPTVVLRKSLLRPRALPGLVRDVVAGLRAGTALLRRLRPAVLYVSTVTVPLWLVAARLRRVPAVVHVHEAEGSAPAVVRAALAAPLLLARAVVANSRFSIDVLARSFPALGRRAELVPNGVPGPTFRSPARAELDTVRLVYVGRLSPRKGVDVAVDAVAALRRDGVAATLDVVGSVFPGYEWYQDELIAQVEALGLGDSVRLHGFVDPVWPLVEQADAVLVPSRVDEPFGNTAVEAVLAARPVIASATSGLLEATAGYGSAQTVRPEDPEALATAVRRVVAGWTWWRDQAWADAEVAESRHAPKVYRAHLARAVEAAARRPHGTSGGAPARAASPATDASRTAGAAPGGPSAGDPRVVVAVLTYRRPDDLAAVLPQLLHHVEPLGDRGEVLVVDNDPDGGAAAQVQRMTGVRYVHEPHPGIAAARNRALDEAPDADLLVFVDDDERPRDGWLRLLLETWRRTGAAAVVGPVVSRYEVEPDPWVAAGRFFDRRRLPTGTVVDVAATNNLLLDLHQLRRAAVRFDERFGLSGGSDTLFSRALVRRGGRMVWCDEAIVDDVVPAARVTRDWVLRRAHRSGNSWSRTSLALAESPGERARVRLVCSARGAVRVAGGAGRWAAGRLRGSAADEARGLRTLRRGLGLLTGAWGAVHVEYHRS